MIGGLALIAALTASHFGLAIQPAEVQGPALSHSTFRVVNTGTQSETLKLTTVQLRAVGHQGWVTAGSAASIATVTPTTLTLAPGKSAKVSVHVDAKDSYRHDVAIEASQSGGTTGQASVAASVAARYVITPDGAVAPSEGALPPQAPITFHGSQDEVIVPGLCGLFVLLSAGLAFALRRKKPKSTPPPLLAPWSER